MDDAVDVYVVVDVAVDSTVVVDIEKKSKVVLAVNTDRMFLLLEYFKYLERVHILSEFLILNFSMC
jgi:hypothetical protein